MSHTRSGCYINKKITITLINTCRSKQYIPSGILSGTKIDIALAEKLLIIHPEGNIKYNPNLYFLAKILVQEGCDVTIFSLRRPEIYQGELFKGANFVYYTANKFKNLKIKLRLLKQKFIHIIGIDTGIIEAEKFASILNVPYSFLSYEIFFDHELKKLKNKTYINLKNKSRKACKGIQFAIIQDEIRKNLLSNEYGIEKDKILLMPVAGSDKRVIPKSDYFYQHLNIPSDRKILLYIGWMDDIQLKRLIEHVNFLPSKWVLVIHSRYKYIGKIPDGFPANKIYFSFNKPIESIDKIGILLGGCDAGFCSYEASYDTPYTGDNIKYIGLSSGKTTTFLQYGIPVVVENMNLWNEIVKNNKIGFELRKKSDLMQLNKLLENDIKQNCFTYFDKYLDINNFMGGIFSAIQNNTPPRKINKKQFALFYGVEMMLIVIMVLKKIKKHIK